MIKYRGFIKKSRTYDYLAIVAVLGVLELNLHLVKTQLGEYYGLVFLIIAGAGAFLRAKTTGPVGQKDVS